MGTIKKGILGGFSGKVGTVVGGSWKGISYMRSLPQKVKKPAYRRTSKPTHQVCNYHALPQTNDCISSYRLETVCK